MSKNHYTLVKIWYSDAYHDIDIDIHMTQIQKYKNSKKRTVQILKISF